MERVLWREAVNFTCIINVQLSIYLIKLSPCYGVTDCQKCTDNPECGWCQSSNTCMPGILVNIITYHT